MKDVESLGSAQFDLHFSDSTAEPELLETHFRHPLLSTPVMSTRGKGMMASSASFQWTRAVRAMCVLFVRTKAESLRDKEGDDQSPFALSSQYTLLASSLDFAISKKPMWLVEMFGISKAGTLFFSRLFSRTNPEQKRVGPVTVYVTRSVLAPSGIRIHIGNKQILRRDELLLLAQSLEVRLHDERELIASRHSQSRSDMASQKSDEPKTLDWKGLLCEAMRDSLRAFDFLSDRSVEERIRVIQSSHYMRSVLPQSAQLRHQIDRSISGSMRFGLGLDPSFLQREICRDPPLSVHLPPSCTGALALFEHLKIHKGYNFEIFYGYSHAVEIARRIVLGQFVEEPDIWLGALGPMATVLSCKAARYKVLMFAPPTQHRFVVSAADSSRSIGRRAVQTIGQALPKHMSKGEFLFLNEEPSSPCVYFEDLVSSGSLDKNTLRATHAEPDEVLSMLKSKNQDLRAICFFPHYEVAKHYADAQIIKPSSRFTLADVPLLVHERVHRNRKLLMCLDVAIRGAWMDLLESQQLRDKIVDHWLKNTQLLPILKRVAGINPE